MYVKFSSIISELSDLFLPICHLVCQRVVWDPDIVVGPCHRRIWWNLLGIFPASESYCKIVLCVVDEVCLSGFSFSFFYFLAQTLDWISVAKQGRSLTAEEFGLNRVMSLLNFFPFSFYTLYLLNGSCVMLLTSDLPTGCPGEKPTILVPNSSRDGSRIPQCTCQSN